MNDAQIYIFTFSFRTFVSLFMVYLLFFPKQVEYAIHMMVILLPKDKGVGLNFLFIMSSRLLVPFGSRHVMFHVNEGGCK